MKKEVKKKRSKQISNNAASSLAISLQTKTKKRTFEFLLLFSSEHRSKRSKNDFFTRDGNAHIVIKPELFFGTLKEALELGVSQEGDGYYVSTSVFAYVDGKVAFWYVEWEVVFVVVVALFLA